MKLSGSIKPYVVMLFIGFISLHSVSFGVFPIQATYRISFFRETLSHTYASWKYFDFVLTFGSENISILLFTNVRTGRSDIGHDFGGIFRNLIKVVGRNRRGIE